MNLFWRQIADALIEPEPVTGHVDSEIILLPSSPSPATLPRLVIGTRNGSA